MAGSSPFGGAPKTGFSQDIGNEKLSVPPMPPTGFPLLVGPDFHNVTRTDLLDRDNSNLRPSKLSNADNSQSKTQDHASAQTNPPSNKKSKANKKARQLSPTPTPQTAMGSGPAPANLPNQKTSASVANVPLEPPFQPSAPAPYNIPTQANEPGVSPFGHMPRPIHAPVTSTEGPFIQRTTPPPLHSTTFRPQSPIPMQLPTQGIPFNQPSSMGNQPAGRITSPVNANIPSSLPVSTPMPASIPALAQPPTYVPVPTMVNSNTFPTAPQPAETSLGVDSTHPQGGTAPIEKTPSTSQPPHPPSPTPSATSLQTQASVQAPGPKTSSHNSQMGPQAHSSQAQAPSGLQPNPVSMVVDLPLPALRKRTRAESEDSGYASTRTAGNITSPPKPTPAQIVSANPAPALNAPSDDARDSIPLATGNVEGVAESAPDQSGTAVVERTPANDGPNESADLHTSIPGADLPGIPLQTNESHVENPLDVTLEAPAAGDVAMTQEPQTRLATAATAEQQQIPSTTQATEAGMVTTPPASQEVVPKNPPQDHYFAVLRSINADECCDLFMRKEVAIIGRGTCLTSGDLDLASAKRSRMVSRKQATLEFNPAKKTFMITTHGKNPTKVDGVLVREGSAPVVDGVVVSFSSIEFRFEINPVYKETNVHG